MDIIQQNHRTIVPTRTICQCIPKLVQVLEAEITTNKDRIATFQHSSKEEIQTSRSSQSRRHHRTTHRCSKMLGSDYWQTVEVEKSPSTHWVKSYLPNQSPSLPIESSKRIQSEDDDQHLYKSIIRTVIVYGYPVLLTANDKIWERLQIVQNRAIRAALNLPLYTSVEYIHRISKLPKIKDYAISALAKSIHKSKLNHDNPLTKYLEDIHNQLWPHWSDNKTNRFSRKPQQQGKRHYSSALKFLPFLLYVNKFFPFVFVVLVLHPNKALCPRSHSWI